MDKWEQADDLSERLDADYPETFILNDENPKFVGVFKRVDSGPSEYGPVPIVVMADQDGKEYGIWLLHAVLRNQFAQQAPKVGELVGIRYLGKKRGASGRDYANYRVAVVRDASAEDFDWSLVSDEAAMADMSTGIAAATDSPENVGGTDAWQRGTAPAAADLKPDGGTF